MCFIDVFVFAGSFRVSLVIELGCAQDLGNMPWHFFDKQAYFKLQSMVGICLLRIFSWHHFFLCQHCNVQENDTTPHFLFCVQNYGGFLCTLSNHCQTFIFVLWGQVDICFLVSVETLAVFQKRFLVFIFSLVVCINTTGCRLQRKVRRI